MFLNYINNIKVALIALFMSLLALKPLPVLQKFDYLVNALWFGDPQEAISSRAGKLVRAGDRGFAYVICRMLSFAGKDYCKKSIQASEGSEELIVLDRGAVIGTVLFLTWPYYSDYVMPFIKVLL